MKSFWAPHAWVGGRWAESVLLRAGEDGCWAEIATGVAAPEHAERLAGAVLPGLVDAHSHAFQRAFAGLTERREAQSDDFWSWRDRMYGVALRITSEQLRAVAAMLYSELLRGGYTQVCEFHYLQHAPDGRPYDDPLCLSWALADAAADAGIGLTMLPVLYQRAGFAQSALRQDQRRFATDADLVRAMQRDLVASGRSLLNSGVAIHSLRAAEPAAIGRLLDGLGDMPVHVHVAEQTAEVEDCLKATGMRPIEWLARHTPLDARWQLVHATHALPGEIDAVARSGAGIVICPSTEANLGDGFTDVPGWLAAGVPLAVGSDSHVIRAWPEELRWLEYGQRLLQRRRNVCAAPEEGEPATAARLFERALKAGGSAAGFAQWGLVKGARADLLVLDAAEPGLMGIPVERQLDALIFSGAAMPFRDVLVAGRWALRAQQPAGSDPSAAFVAAMHSLWDAG
ncbi:MAG: formimidoylglutamate deiminase [Burkholderiales bacterium]|nr:formimidoylglutamate deiminase [Burkholderiales bacterium]